MKKHTSKLTKYRPLIISLVVILLIATSMAILFLLNKGEKEPQAFFARDINDASYDCEQKIIDQFDEQLVSKYFDDLSSRYLPEKRQYLIYYRVSTRTLENNIPVNNELMVKCTVWERLGYVSDFHIMRDF